MKKIKLFKTHEEQIEILKSKGLKITENAIEILKRNNYYFLINRYKDIFTIPNTKPSKFKENVTFNDILALYHFDRDLRALVLKNIIIIENTIKSIVFYEYSKKYNYGYLDEQNFTAIDSELTRKAIKSLFDSINDVIRKGIQSRKYINYYYQNYQKIPLWVIINDLSLSLSIKFYNLLKDSDKTIIANYFNLSPNELYVYLQFVKYYRNLSAHNQRLFDEKNEFTIRTNSLHEKFNLGKNNNLQGKNDIMALIIIFKNMLSDNDFTDFKKQLLIILNNFDSQVDSIDNYFLINYMGLIQNWHEI